MPLCASPPMGSWCPRGAFFPPVPAKSNFAYPACRVGSSPGDLPVRTERHNPHSIATIRRHIATHLARILPRCPCCLRGYFSHSSTNLPRGFGFVAGRNIVYRNPSSLVKMHRLLCLFPATLGFYCGIPSSISSFLVGGIHHGSESSVDSKNNKARYLDPKFYRVASVLFFLFGTFLIGWGWWDAHYGNRAVWKGIAVAFIGFWIGAIGIALLLSHCC